MWVDLFRIMWEKATLGIVDDPKFGDNTIVQKRLEVTVMENICLFCLVRIAGAAVVSEVCPTLYSRAAINPKHGHLFPLNIHSTTGTVQ